MSRHVAFETRTQAYDVSRIETETPFGPLSLSKILGEKKKNRAERRRTMIAPSTTKPSPQNFIMPKYSTTNAAQNTNVGRGNASRAVLWHEQGKGKGKHNCEGKPETNGHSGFPQERIPPNYELSYSHREVFWAPVQIATCLGTLPLRHERCA